MHSCHSLQVYVNLPLSPGLLNIQFLIACIVANWSERRHETNGTLCLPSSGPRRCLMQGTGATCRQKLFPFLDQFLGPLSNLTLPLAKCVHVFPNPCFLHQEENMVWLVRVVLLPGTPDKRMSLPNFEDI